MLVSHADHFRWRDGGFGDLIPLLGDGMLTIDGDFHKQSRRIMLPAFHHERVTAAIGVMEEEIERALRAWHDGLELDLYAWARELALRVAMRALFGFDPDLKTRDTRPAREFERALGFYGREYWLQVLRGPGTPWAALTDARRKLDRLIYAEIAHRRRTGHRGDDVLSLLLDAPLSDRHVRDHVMTLLFAGHDTTTATIAFLFYELARHPDVADAAAADPQLLEQALDETLRLYPPAWIGPRRAARDFEFAGHRIAEGAPVNYSSWASHRLPDVWEEPARVPPRALRPRGAQAHPQGRLRPVRRRLADLPRDALRPGRDPRDRDAPSASASASSCRTASGCGSARRRRSGRHCLGRGVVTASLGLPSASGWHAKRATNRFRSEEVVPEGEGGPRWQAVSR